MKFDEYRSHDALALAQLVQKGEVSAGELVDAAVARAEAVNPALNAIIYPLYQQARQRAGQELSGPFAGVPFLLKDLYQELAGVPAAYGCKALKQQAKPSPFSTEITQRWLQAGLLPIGRTNTPEFGAKAITEPEAWGATRNPWNTQHVPGGSSGGSAAAVAAGVVPMAGANDGGGSIRIPAGHCGLFGLKPGRGRTPWGPHFSEALQGAAINHVVTRSVRDSAALLDATHGPETGSFFVIKPPERSYLEECQREPGKLKIGYSTRSPIGTEVDPEAVQAVENTARLLESLGHEVEEGEPAINGMQLARDFMVMWFGNVATTVDAVKRETGCGTGGFELDTLIMAAFGHATRASEFAQSAVNWNEYSRALSEFHQRYDLWLSPTMARPPAQVGQIATPQWQQNAANMLLKMGLSRVILKTGIIEQMVQENLQWVPYTQLGNMTGTPGMSVPMHWTAQGLPLGVQFMAPPCGEGLLFRLAAQLEQAQPWADRWPAL